MIENLSSKIDSLSGQTSRTGNSELDHVDTESQASTSRSTVTNELPLLEGQHSGGSKTGVSHENVLLKKQFVVPDASLEK